MEKQILLKLKALKDKMSGPTGSMSGIHVDDYENYVTLFEKYHKELTKINPDLYGDFVPTSLFPRMANDEYIGEFHLVPIKKDIQYLLDIAPNETLIKPTDFTITTEGIYFSGQYYDALAKISEILKKAINEIVLIDGYLNDQFIDIFTIVNPGVEIKILTKSNSHNPAVKLKVANFNKQFNQQKTKMEIKENSDFHDRFLILDRKEFYHFGASLKDAGNKGFMFSKIEEPFVQQSLLSEFGAKW